MKRYTRGQARSVLPNLDSLWDYDRPDETEKRFRKLLPVSKASGDTSYYAQVLTQIARTQALQRQFEGAHHTLNRVQNLLTKSLLVPRIRYLLERGRVLNSSGKVSESRRFFLQAWKLAKKSREDFYAVDAAHMIAIIETPKRKLEGNLRAIEYATKSSNPLARKWLVSLYNNLGWAYFEMKKYPQPLKIFRKALRLREKEGRVHETRIAKWCVGRTLRAMNRVREALGIQETLLHEFEAEGEKSGYVYEETAECLLALGQHNKARKFFALVYKELSKNPWLVANEPDRLKRLNELGKMKWSE